MCQDVLEDFILLPFSSETRFVVVSLCASHGIVEPAVAIFSLSGASNSGHGSDMRTGMGSFT